MPTRPKLPDVSCVAGRPWKKSTFDFSRLTIMKRAVIVWKREERRKQMRGMFSHWHTSESTSAALEPQSFIPSLASLMPAPIYMPAKTCTQLTIIWLFWACAWIKPTFVLICPFCWSCEKRSKIISLWKASTWCKCMSANGKTDGSGTNSLSSEAKKKKKNPSCTLIKVFYNPNIKKKKMGHCKT